MNAATDVLQFIANNIFNQVSILIGLITLIGLAVQRKPVEEVIAGALRATIGVVILFIGVDVFSKGLSSFQAIVASAVGLQPPKAQNSLDGFLAQQGGTVAMVITVGFLTHLLAVRVLRTRYVYLTGHLLFWMAVVVTASLVEAYGQVPQWKLVVGGSLIVASYWTVQPLFMAPAVRKVMRTDQEQWGFGHTSSSTSWLAYRVSSLVGSRERNDVENVRLPKRLSFFKDVNVSTVVVIGLIVLVAIGFADHNVVAREAANAGEGDVNIWVWGVLASLRFAAGIAILLYGVRMFLGEIVPAFKGISEKIIPGSRPALDAPTLFPTAPTAVMAGFVTAVITFLILMGVFAAAGWFVLVPSMIMIFFVGASGGVFGNASGGWRGSVLAGALVGIVLAVGQAVTWGMLGSTAPELATLADPDWYLMIWLLLAIGSPLGNAGGAAFWVAPGAVVIIAAVWITVLKSLQRRRERTQAQAVANQQEQAVDHGQAGPSTRTSSEEGA